MEKFEHSPIERKPTPELDKMFDLIKSDSTTWNTSDFDRINELSLTLINLEKELNKERTINDKNYEDCKTKAWLWYKDKKRSTDWKAVSEKQADYLAKHEANKRYLDNQAETDFWFVKSMIKFIDKKLIQMWVTNKDQRELEHNIR